MSKSSLLDMLKRFARGRTTLVLGDGFCGIDEEPNGLSRLREALGLLKKLYADRDIVCIVSLCSLPLLEEYLGRALVLYTGNEVSKHRLDEYLKCLSISDTILILSLSKPCKPIADSIPLAIAMGKDVVVFSKGFRDLDWIDRSYKRIDIDIV